MVLAELERDIREGEVCQLPDQIHGDLPGLGGALGALGAADHVLVDGVEAADFGQDQRRRGQIVGAALVHVLDGARDVHHVERHIVEVVIGLDLLDRALELADVVGDVFRDVVAHVVAQVEPQALGLVLDDGHAGLVIRLCHVADQAGFKAGAQPVGQLDHVAGRLVRGQHDLLVVGMQGVEGVEELLLGLLLAGDELDVVEQKQVGVAVFVAEFQVFALADGLDQLVRELLAGDIDDVDVGVPLLHLGGDGVEQVGLAQAGVAVEEERVIHVRRLLHHGQRRVVGDDVGGSDDEFFKGELGIELDEVIFGFAVPVAVHVLLTEDLQRDVGAEDVLHGIDHIAGAAPLNGLLAEL